MRRTSRLFVFVCVSPVLPSMLGCQVGPSLYRASFHDYNEAIRQTTDEQMLANLVRMRYIESPVFLQVSSISTQFAVTGNVGASATLTENSGGVHTPGVLGLRANGGYEERPTITFSIPESREFFGRMMAPLSADQITMLMEAGYNTELVMKTALRSMNRLQNASVRFSNFPQAPPSYDGFLEVFSLLKKLQAEGLVDFGAGIKESVWSSPLANVQGEKISDVLLLAAEVFALTNGAELIKDENDKWQAYTFYRRLALRFSPASDDSPDARRLRELLGLAPEQYSFAISNAELTVLEKRRFFAHQAAGALDPEAIWTEVGIQGRSMMEILQIASTAVRVPTKHLEQGSAIANPLAQTSDSNAGERMNNWMVIHSSREKPPNSRLRIKYRGYWYFIKDNDLRSRESFTLLGAVFAVTGGTVPGAHPILTLPVGK